MAQLTLPRKLTQKEEIELLERVSIGDESAKKLLIEHNLRLVYFIANKFKGSLIEKEDLASIGSIGLIKAVNTFNLDKKVKFATYSSRCIENEILMFLRQNKKRNKDVSMEYSVSYDAEGNELSIADILSCQTEIEDAIEKQSEIQILKKIINKLPEKEKEIIKLRFGIDREKFVKQEEIADMLNISQSYVSRIEKKILRKIKKDFAKEVS